MAPISGRVYRYEGPRGVVWRAKYRLPDGRQVHRTIGPVWSGRGRPRAGYLTKRTAEDWLREVLGQARAGVLPGMVRTGVTVTDAAGEYLRWLGVDRQRKPSTLQDYRSVIRAHVLPEFGDTRVEDLAPEVIERWLATLSASNRTKAKILVIFGGPARDGNGARAGRGPVARGRRRAGGSAGVRRGRLAHGRDADRHDAGTAPAMARRDEPAAGLHQRAHPAGCAGDGAATRGDGPAERRRPRSGARCSRTS